MKFPKAVSTFIKNIPIATFGSRYPVRTDPDGFFQPYGFRSFIYNEAGYYNNYAEELEKLKVVFTSPALLKVIKLQCDLFSLGKLYVYDENEVDISKGDPALDRFDQPNFNQQRSQFLWDFMFWKMLGNAYCYINSNIPENETMQMYFLDTTKMRWPDSFLKTSDKMVFSKAGIKAINDTIIDYVYLDGTNFQVRLGDITIINDLTNGVGNRFKGPSVIDSLYKVINNAEAVIDATNINIRYTGKFIVAGQADPNDVNKIPLSDSEKQDVETKVNGYKQVHAMKSMIEIKRFVENLGNLKLPEQYAAQYYIIGNMYNIPKDVLEAYAQTGATFENQEKSVGRHIAYALQPAGENFLEAVSKRWGYDKLGKEICISWDHLLFMQVFKKDLSTVNKTVIDTLTAMLKLGISIEECNKFLDTNFKKAEYVQPKPAQTGTGNQGQSANG